MNRHYWIYFGAIALLALLSCKEDQPRPRDSGSLDSSAHEKSNQNDKDPFTDTLFLDSLLDRLLLLQNAVVKAPERKELIQPFITASLDTVAACMYVVGQAASAADSSGETDQFKAKRLAKAAALQWALLVKSWISGTHIRYGAAVQGNVLYSRELLERRKEDTLLVLFMVPVGSAVVR